MVSSRHRFGNIVIKLQSNRRVDRYRKGYDSAKTGIRHKKRGQDENDRSGGTQMRPWFFFMEHEQGQTLLAEEFGPH